MKVLLISPNRERVPDPVFPLGIAYLVAALRRRGHDVSVLDLCFAGDIEEAVRERITSFMPEVIGLSLRNIDDVSYPKCVSYLDLYRDVAAYIRKYSTAPLVLGGAGLTIMPGEFLRELKADYAVAGEGEHAFPDLLDVLAQNGEVCDRIIRSGGTEAAWTELRPDRSLLDSGKYYQFGGMLNFQTKRGCPFGCIYCSYPLIEGRASRTRDAAEVADELESVVAATGVRHFFVVDSIFNHPSDHAGRICDEIIRRGLDIRWTCYGNPAFLSEGLAQKMRAAGCTSIEFGTDSMIDETLGYLRKGFTFRDITNASEICRRADIKFCHFIFIGAPGDTADRVKLNMERLEGLGADVSVIMTGIRIFPNTPIAAVAERDLGIRTADLSLQPVHYVAPDVIRDMDAIVQHIRDNHPKWILPGFEINISEKLQMILRKAGIKGSLWEEFINR